MRIAIAHASRLGARAVTMALAQDPAHHLTWTVHSGADALRKVEQERPDLLLLDVAVSNPSCLEVTRLIMDGAPLSIILLADRPEDHTFRVYEAMSLGALDVVTCPSFTQQGALHGEAQLFTKLRTVQRLSGLAGNALPLGHGRAPHATGKLIAIGASTGGPQAIFDILAGLDPNQRASIVLVQHVESEFSPGFASWLQQGTKLKVVLAKAGMRPDIGTALLAATNDHLVMTANGSFTYTSHPQEVPYRPSVDALFRSLAEHWAEPGVAVLLTGMGRDGAEGMKRLRQRSWHTIAQDERTSVVFGMPKAAIELGAAEQVLPLPEIAGAIARACR
jgi:two-component system response regulator WspF